jgi:hypothetical protein
MALTKIKTGSVSDSITLTTPDINGGTIDATVIGGTTPAAISGTTGTFSSTVRAVGTTLTSASSATLAFTGTTSRLESRGADVSTRGAIQLMQATSNGSNEIVALGFDAAGTATFNAGVNIGGNSIFNAPNIDIKADDARLLIEEADGTNMVWLGDLTGAGVGGCFLYNHGGTAVVQLRSDSASTIGHGLTVGGTVHASQTYTAPTNGISADTVGIFSKNNTANGNANVSVLSRSSGEARLYLGDETDENKWAITSKSYGGGLCFESAGTTRMTIDTAGTIQSQYGTSTGYSQTSGYGGMNYQNDNGSTGGALILTTNADRGWSNMYLNKFNWASGKDVRSIQFTVNGGVVGTIGTTSTATAYNTSSDYRLKENVVPMTGSIDRLKALKPSQFNFIVDSDTTVDGFLAHEAQAVVPECVTGTKDAMRDEEYEVTAAVEEVRDEDDNVTTEAAEAVMGTRSVPDMQGIDQSKLVPLLVAALQEAIARIEILEGA